MTSRPRGVRAAVAVLALLAPAFIGGPASAAPPAAVEYDALGDSYASGAGVPPYTGGNCARSEAAYAAQLDGRMRIDLDDFVACAGAKTSDMISQLPALDADTDLVTVSIGGNDIGWSTAVVACLVRSDDDCSAALGFTRNRITSELPALLDSVYTRISEAAPEAHVVVTGYPRLFSPEYGDFLGASAAEQEALNEGADLLNATIAAAAAEHGFLFVDVTKRFLGHGVNSSDAWILGPFDPGAFHPNADGYEAYTAAVTAAIRPSRL